MDNIEHWLQLALLSMQGMISYPWMVYNGKLLNLVTIVSLMVVALCRLMVAMAPSQNVEYCRRKSVRWAGMVCEKEGLARW